MKQVMAVVEPICLTDHVPMQEQLLLSALCLLQVHGDYQETLYKIVRGALAPSSVTSSSGLNSVVLQQHSPDALLIVLGSQVVRAEVLERL